MDMETCRDAFVHLTDAIAGAERMYYPLAELERSADGCRRIAFDADGRANPLNEELATQSIHGEVYLAGGAVMCLARGDARKWMHSWFRRLSCVARHRLLVNVEGLQPNWLNDA